MQLTKQNLMKLGHLEMFSAEHWCFQDQPELNTQPYLFISSKNLCLDQTFNWKIYILTNHLTGKVIS